MSGRGGKVAISLELKSGQAPGKEGVGEAATIVEREQQANDETESRNIMIPLRYHGYLVKDLQGTFDSPRYALRKVVNVLPV